MKQNETFKAPPRLVTLAYIKQVLLPNWFSEVPCDATVRQMLARAGVQRYQANPNAKKGGGTVHYSLADVERVLSKRMLPGKLVGR